MICPDCSFELAGIIWGSFLILKRWVASPSAAVCACVGVRGGGWLTAAHRRLHGRAPLCCLRLTKNPSFTATRAQPLRSGAWRLLLGVSLWWSAAGRPCFSSSSSREQMKHVLVVTLWQWTEPRSAPGVVRWFLSLKTSCWSDRLLCVRRGRDLTGLERSWCSSGSEEPSVLTFLTDLHTHLDVNRTISTALCNVWPHLEVSLQPILMSYS